MLGDCLSAITESGTISTESCYSEESKFVTTNGRLHLKNVHKSSEVLTLDGGTLDVTGFHGTLKAKTNGGRSKFQLTEIYGESSIESIDPKEFTVNISEFVEENTRISTDVKGVELQPTLSHLSDKISEGGQFRLGDADRTADQLTLKSNGNLRLGKMSWTDMIKLKFSSSS